MRRGRFTAFIGPKQYDESARELELRQKYVACPDYMVPRDAQNQEIGFGDYFGGIVIPDVASIHPGLYQQGLSPPPTGVYSHIVAATGKQLYISGQLPRDLAGNLVGPNDMVVQYRKAWTNLTTALHAVGLGPEHLVKVTIFAVGESNLAGIRTARQEFLLPNPPAITMVFVSALAQPGALIEIEGIAAFPEGG